MLTVLFLCTFSLASMAYPQDSPSTDYSTLCRVFDTPARQENAGQMLATYQLNKQLESDRIRNQQLSQISTSQQVRERAKAARQAYIKSMGGLPTTRAPLKAQVVGEIDRGDYIIKKVLFQDFDQMWVSASLYLPKPLGSAQRPAVLAPMGHGQAGKNAHWFQQRAIQLVRFGYIVLGYDPVGMGERWQYWDAATGKDIIGSHDPDNPKYMYVTDTHSYAGVQAWLVGQSLSQYMVWDGMRGIDYLLTLPQVNPHRIAVSGASLGGSTTMMLAAIDNRITCAVPTCDVTSFAEMAKVKMARDAEQIPLGITREHWEQADALLPMLLHGGSVMLNANTDDFFPIAGSRQAAKELTKLYADAGVPNHFAFAENPGTHGWFPETYASFYGFLHKQFSFGLANPTHQITNDDTLKEAQLWCTPKGQVSAAPLKSKTVFDRTSQTAIQLQAQRRQHSDAQILTAAKERSGVREFSSVPTAQLVDQPTHGAMDIEKWILNIEPEIELPAVLIHSAHQATLPQKVLLYCSRAGKSSVFNSQKFPLQNWLAKGYAVFAVDARGWGETMWANLPDNKVKPPAIYFDQANGDEATLTFNALQEGTTLLGQRASDLLAAARWLESQKGKLLAKDATISLWGEGEAGVCALHTMAGDDHHIIQNAFLDQTLYSYQDWATTRFYKVPVGLVIPGILEDYDLPQLAQALRYRNHNENAVVWINPLDATGHELSKAHLQLISKNTTIKSAPNIITGEPLMAAGQALKLLEK